MFPFSRGKCSYHHDPRSYEELGSHGARVLDEPKDYPFGMRDFSIKDLDGNQLSFGMESMTQGA
jgi:hypothetical protein